MNEVKMYSRYGKKLDRYFCDNLREKILLSEQKAKEKSKPKLQLPNEDIFDPKNIKPKKKPLSPRIENVIKRNRRKVIPPREVVPVLDSTILTDFDKIVKKNLPSAKNQRKLQPIKKLLTTPKKKINTRTFSVNDSFGKTVSGLISMDKMMSRRSVFHIKLDKSKENSRYINLKQFDFQAPLNESPPQREIKAYAFEKYLPNKEDKKRLISQVLPRQIFHESNYDYITPKTSFNVVDYSRNKTFSKNDKTSLRYWLLENNQVRRFLSTEEKEFKTKMIPFDKTLGRVKENQKNLPMYMFNINSSMQNVCVTERSLREMNFFDDKNSFEENPSKKISKPKIKKEEVPLLRFRNIKKNEKYKNLSEHIKKMKGYFSFGFNEDGKKLF